MLLSEFEEWKETTKAVSLRLPTGMPHEPECRLTPQFGRTADSPGRNCRVSVSSVYDQVSSSDLNKRVDVLKQNWFRAIIFRTLRAHLFFEKIMVTQEIKELACTDSVYNKAAKPTASKRVYVSSEQISLPLDPKN